MRHKPPVAANVSMTVTHTFYIIGKCPVNGSNDYYTVEVTLDRLMPVERMLGMAKHWLNEPVYQETFTRALAIDVVGKVRTTCLHGDVTTRCEAEYPAVKE